MKLGLFMPSNRMVAYLISHFKLSLLSTGVARLLSQPAEGKSRA